MKTLFNYTIIVLLFCTSCSSTDDTSSDFSSLTEKESYSIIEDKGFYNDIQSFSDRIEIKVKDNRLIGSFTNITAKYY